MDKNELCDIGLAYKEKKDYFKAIKCYDQAIELDSEFILAWEQKLEIYLDTEEYNKVIECCDKMLEINPDNYEMWYNKGLAYFEKDDLNKAIRCANKAIKINPRHGYTLVLLGDIYEEKGYLHFDEGLWDKVIESFDKYIEMYAKLMNLQGGLFYEPSIQDAEVWHHKGLAHFNIWEYDKAIKSYNSSLKLKKEMDAWDHMDLRKEIADTLFRKGCAYLKKENYVKAVEFYDEAKEIDPKIEIHEYKLAKDKKKERKVPR